MSFNPLPDLRRVLIPELMAEKQFPADVSPHDNASLIRAMVFLLGSTEILAKQLERIALAAMQTRDFSKDLHDLMVIHEYASRVAKQCPESASVFEEAARELEA